jgi:para-aminobenzoate synthetase component I
MATSAVREAARGEALAVTPLVRELPAELTPLRALAAVERSPHTVFFESGGDAGPDAGSEWTLLAFDPVGRIELRARADSLDSLARAWPERVELAGEVRVPFASGLAGYVGYDAKGFFERYPSRARSASSLPDVSLGFYDVVWAWERRSGRGWAVATGLPERDPTAREARARVRLADQWDRVTAGTMTAPAGGPTGGGDRSGGRSRARGDGPRVTSNFARGDYLAAVERALAHIAAGDIYQVNLAQRFQVESAPDPPTLYRALRECSPAPFEAFVSFPGGGIASSSPERFFRVDHDRIETWPIKGTRPRGAAPDEDAALAAALRASEKDRAENVMIVDLERNDLGRVCEIGSIRVTSLWDVASFSNVHHLVSRVEGRLRADATPVDVLRALFPGGSITGAPKIRAVEIIDSLEPTRRGVYTGSIGYWDVRGGCDWNIAIRTIVIEGGAASFHAGGGIVADSTPEGEYEETLIKARGMFAAMGVRWEG